MSCKTIPCDRSIIVAGSRDCAGGSFWMGADEAGLPFHLLHGTVPGTKMASSTRTSEREKFLGMRRRYSRHTSRRSLTHANSPTYTDIDLHLCCCTYAVVATSIPTHLRTGWPRHAHSQTYYPTYIHACSGHQYGLTDLYTHTYLLTCRSTGLQTYDPVVRLASIARQTY